MQVHRFQNEGQENPKDQARTLLAAMHGWMHNLQDGRSTPERVVEQMNILLDKMNNLIKRYPDLEWDTPPFTQEKENNVATSDNS